MFSDRNVKGCRFRVRISRSLQSSEFGVIGRPLIIASNSHINVLKLSSSKLFSLMNRRSVPSLSF